MAHSSHSFSAGSRDNIDVRRGASRCLYLAAGSSVIARQGALRLTEPPRWLADQISQPSVRICANAAHVVQHSGWVRLDALQDCRVEVVMPQAAPVLIARLRAALRAALQAWQHASGPQRATDQA